MSRHEKSSVERLLPDSRCKSTNNNWIVQIIRWRIHLYYTRLEAIFKKSVGFIPDRLHFLKHRTIYRWKQTRTTMKNKTMKHYWLNVFITISTIGNLLFNPIREAIRKRLWPYLAMLFMILVIGWTTSWWCGPVLIFWNMVLFIGWREAVYLLLWEIMCTFAVENDFDLLLSYLPFQLLCFFFTNVLVDFS